MTILRHSAVKWIATLFVITAVSAACGRKADPEPPVEKPKRTYPAGAPTKD